MNLSNTQFVFERKTKNVLIGGMILGVICLALTAMNDDALHTRFWTSWLHNSVYFSGIAFMSMFFMSAQITAFAGWNTVVRRVWEAMSQFMWVGIILMSVMVIGVWGHLHHLYHWNTPGIAEVGSATYDRIIAGKASFLNPVWYTLGTMGFLGIWYFWAYKLRQTSIEQDTNETPGSFAYYKKQRKWAASFLPLGGFLSTVFFWQSVMSIDTHWYSTMFAWYSMVSVWLGSISLTVMLIIYLKSLGYMEYVTRDHLHDIGKFLFGISVFWTYLWFDQFMLIWYANNGEETIYFKERMNHYPVLFWGNLLLNFITPFLILMRNDTKRKFGTMFFVALIVFVGHWWDYFYMIKPGARIAAHEHMMHEQHGGATHGAINPFKTETVEAGVQHGMTATSAATQSAAHVVKEQVVEHAVEAAPAHGETATTHDSTGAAHAEGEQMPAEHAAEHATAEHAEAAHGDAHAGGHDAVDESKSFKLGYTLPALEDIGVMIGFLSLFLFFFFNQLTKASMVPMRDPYLEESLHHETGALISTEQDEHGHDDHH